MSKNSSTAGIYVQPTNVVPENLFPQIEPVMVENRLPPPLPPKNMIHQPSLPAKPQELIDEVRYARNFPTIPNYEELAFENAAVGNQVPCRITDDLVHDHQPTVLPIPTVDYPVITREQAVLAFKEYVSSKWCWDHKFLDTLRVYDDEMEYCYIMTLDSYYESRGACWNESKLTSEAIIGPDQGIPPAPWDLRIPMPSFFQDCVRSVPVPFTQICRKCNSCSGTGQELCSTCTGSGFCVCSECQGKQNDSPCKYCYGTGKTYCAHCNGIGHIGCPICDGRGAVLRWIDVLAEYKTRSIVNVIERGGLNKEYLKLLEGKPMYNVQGWKLVEGDSFYDSEVNEAVRNLFTQTEEFEAQYEIVSLQQRLRVSVVPVRILHCESDNNRFDVSVFDMDCKIYCPEYPVQTCGLWKNIASMCSVQ